jgi:hypothetical protein
MTLQVALASTAPDLLGNRMILRTLLDLSRTLTGVAVTSAAQVIIGQVISAGVSAEGVLSATLRLKGGKTAAKIAESNEDWAPALGGFPRGHAIEGGMIIEEIAYPTVTLCARDQAAHPAARIVSVAVSPQPAA